MELSGLAKDFGGFTYLRDQFSSATFEIGLGLGPSIVHLGTHLRDSSAGRCRGRKQPYLRCERLPRTTNATDST